MDNIKYSSSVDMMMKLMISIDNQIGSIYLYNHAMAINDINDAKIESNKLQKRLISIKKKELVERTKIINKQSLFKKLCCLYRIGVIDDLIGVIMEYHVISKDYPNRKRQKLTKPINIKTQPHTMAIEWSDDED